MIWYTLLTRGKNWRSYKGVCIITTCYMCEGRGEREYGMVAEGIYPDVETWYRGMDDCDRCNGTGKIENEDC